MKICWGQKKVKILNMDQTQSITKYWGQKKVRIKSQGPNLTNKNMWGTRNDIYPF